MVHHNHPDASRFPPDLLPFGQQTTDSMHSTPHTNSPVDIAAVKFNIMQDVSRHEGV
jgi:hypothetical protein